MCFVKGKLGTGVIGIVTPFVALVGAIPPGPAELGLGPPPLRRGEPQAGAAEAREAAFDARWRSKIRAFQDRVAGFGS